MATTSRLPPSFDDECQTHLAPNLTPLMLAPFFLKQKWPDDLNIVFRERMHRVRFLQFYREQRLIQNTVTIVGLDLAKFSNIRKTICSPMRLYRFTLDQQQQHQQLPPP